MGRRFAGVASNPAQIHHLPETFPPIASNQDGIICPARRGQADAHTTLLRSRISAQVRRFFCATYNAPCGGFSPRRRGRLFLSLQPPASWRLQLSSVKTCRDLQLFPPQAINSFKHTCESYISPRRDLKMTQPLPLYDK